MIRFVLRNLRSSFSTNRKQNFFQLNPIYPDYGQKDFDIYNVERKRVAVFDKFVPIKKRHQRVKEIIKDQFLLRKYKIREMHKKDSKQDVDEDSGLPIGLNATYDSFIIQYKKAKNKSHKIQFEFKNLLMSLVSKFKVKTQLELIKLFRISLAHSKKNDFKEKIRGKLLEEAVVKAAAAKNDYFSDFFTDQVSKSTESGANEMNEEKLDELSFQQALKNIDQKIQKIQNELRVKKTLNGLDEWDPVYGKKIEEKFQMNNDYDMNLKRGFRGFKTVDEFQNVHNQDEFIRRKVNRLFFLRKLEYLKKDSPFVFDSSELPMKLKEKQKIINQLAHKYKEDEFLVAPNLKEIYEEIDIALDKVSIRLNADTSSYIGDGQKKRDQNPVEETTFSNDELLWTNLDVQQVFTVDYYSKQNVQKQTLSQKQLLHVTPSASVQLSLSRVPFNLYRHSECEVFNVFTNYKHMILKDYLKDLTIDPKGDFNYFSLQQASNLLNRIKKPQLSDSQKYYGHAKRKKSEAEVFVKHGTGVVIINKQSINDYFSDTYHRVQALKPLIFSQTAGQYDLEFTVVGGGLHGQSQSCAYALARALMKINPAYRKIFRSFALDSHDPRQKEPKRMGLYSARVRPPYVRR